MLCKSKKFISYFIYSSKYFHVYVKKILTRPKLLMVFFISFPTQNLGITP